MRLMDCVPALLAAGVMLYLLWRLFRAQAALRREREENSRLRGVLEESARVDGATEMQMFLKIVLPLVAPGIAAVAMLSFMYAWNEYTYTVIFTRSPDNYTVPLALSLLNSEDNLTSFGLVAAGGVVSVIPITLFVIFAQNYLISGLSSGAVKE